MKIVLLHYRYAPAIAGVELILEQHARLMADVGHEVTVVAGEGASRDPRVRVVVIPELRGGGTASWLLPAAQEVEAMGALLRPWVEWADRVLVHNVMTMPFALGATLALERLAVEFGEGRMVSWVHDLAAVNPDYVLEAEVREVLSRGGAGMAAVAISPLRAQEFRDLTGRTVDAVVPNGIDPAPLLGLPEAVARFAGEEGLLGGGLDLVLFQPARILRRKNIELGIRVVAALKAAGRQVKLLITGAPDGHNLASVGYYAELIRLREECGVEREVIFVGEFFAVTKRDLVGLYTVSDGLWFPSRQEGFGLPVLEGALHRMLVFCADVPPMNSMSLPHVTFFNPQSEAGAIARQVLEVMAREAEWLDARRVVLQRFAWHAVWQQIEAFLKNPTGGRSGHVARAPGGCVRPP